MKKFLLVFTFPRIVFGGTGNSGLNSELLYIYGAVIVFILIVLGIDKLIKFVRIKLNERSEKLQEQNQQQEKPDSES